MLLASQFALQQSAKSKAPSRVGMCFDCAVDPGGKQCRYVREKWSRPASIFELLASAAADDLPNRILKNQLDPQTLSSRREEIQTASRKFGSGMSAAASAPTEIRRALGVARRLFEKA